MSSARIGIINLGSEKLPSHDVADCEFFLHPGLADVLTEDDDLLNGVVSKDTIDLVPKIGTPFKPAAIDPYPIARDRELGRKPERKFVVVGRSMRNKDACARGGRR